MILCKKQKKHTSIVFDGPIGAGKTTISREIAKRHDCTYFNTDNIVKAYAYVCVQNNVEYNIPEMVRAILSTIHLNFETIQCANNKELVIKVGERNITHQLDDYFVLDMAQKLGSNALFSEIFRNAQKEIAEKFDIVVDCGELSNAVLPNPGFKFYITAEPEVRRKRIPSTKQQFLNYKLEKSADALVINTSSLNIKESIDKVDYLLTGKSQNNQMQQKI